MFELEGVELKDPRPGWAEPLRRGRRGFREDLAPAGLPAGGPRVARMRRGCGACGRRSLTGAGPGRTVRTMKFVG